MVLTTLHHLFLQSCMSRRAMSEKTASVVYERCIQVVGDEDNAPPLVDMLQEINDVLHNGFGFSLKRFIDEHTGRAWIAFVNTRSDELAKVATEYGPQEISYFRTLIKLIMRSGKRYAVTSMEARKAGSSIQPHLAPSQAEAVLANFVARGWFVVTKTNAGRESHVMYQLSSRARMELEDYLKEEFPRQTDKDYECVVCNEIVMRGAECLVENCRCRMHEHCSRLYVSRNGQARAQCPKCRIGRWVYNDLHIIGPGATDTTYDGSSSDESDGEGGRANGRDVENEDDGETPAPAPAARRGKGKGRASETNGRPSTKRGSGVPRGSQRDNDMDEDEDEEPANPKDEDDEDIDQLQDEEEEQTARSKKSKGGRKR